MKGRTKYFSRKVERDGMIFDSAKEWRRWIVLKAMEANGEISHLERQREFEIIPEQREPDTIGPKGGVHRGRLLERRAYYVADFVYRKDGELVVEDVKGYRDGQAYTLYILKRKLMLFRHGIQVKEV